MPPEIAVPRCGMCALRARAVVILLVAATVAGMLAGDGGEGGWGQGWPKTPWQQVAGVAALFALVAAMALMLPSRRTALDFVQDEAGVHYSFRLPEVAEGFAKDNCPEQWPPAELP